MKGLVKVFTGNTDFQKWFPCASTLTATEVQYADQLLPVAEAVLSSSLISH